MHEWRDHEAEVELYIEAENEGLVFVEAITAFAELLEPEPGGEPAEHELRLEGSDRASLLIALLQELIYLADTEGFAADQAALTVGPAMLRGSVRGRRTNVKPLVKAATWHNLEFRRADGVWQARVVLDV
jgi:SHS2 domain-containing protein